MKINNFTDIDSWKEARLLVSEIYKLTSGTKFSKDFGLKDQIQRASISIMSNIAEGFDSGSAKSFINFLKYSYRSSSEVESLIYLALDLNYIEEGDFIQIQNRIKKIKNLLGGFIKYLKSID
ncbi:four helix bundle protein [Melioribacter sp. OK-6-Me]|uniref:four helix bundle protein n=1 Tax=unclassified Melioribacter TaxID=2627329 RepID=UPI003ED89065